MYLSSSRTDRTKRDVSEGLRRFRTCELYLRQDHSDTRNLFTVFFG